MEKEESDKKAQQDFCKGALENIQNLIRFMDIKGGAILTMAGLLTAVLYGLVIFYMDNDAASGKIHYFLLVVVVVYFINLAIVMCKASLIFFARPGDSKNYSSAPLMLFPLLILKNHNTDKDYKERAENLSCEDILADYSNQIIVCSKIYEIKHDHVNSALNWVVLLLIPWFIFISGATIFLFLC